MRYSILVLIILTAMVTQSCKITTPSLIKLIGELHRKGRVYDFNTSKAMVARTGFRDTLIIGDRPESRHGMSMKEVITDMRIPEESLVFFETLGGSGNWRRPINLGLPKLMLQNHEQLRLAAKVAHIPYRFVLKSAEDLPIIEANNILFVVSGGNMANSWGGDRDVYNINHIIWSHDDPERDRLYKESYRALLKIRNSGKVISATSALTTGTGKISPFRSVAKCGESKETCFTIVPAQFTSPASAGLAAMSFYLAQFFETPEKIIEVLGACAIDVGEPGTDREYGRGIANLLCPQVLKKEIEVVSAHLGETEEKVFHTTGGDLEGIWKADSTTLQVYLPTTLKKTLEAEYAGTVNGTVEFEENKIKTDFTAKAEVSVVFLLADPIKTKAEDVVHLEGAYTTEENILRMPGEAIAYTYTATEDSLHLVKSFSLNEILSLLPDPLGSMVDIASPDFFVDDPIQIRMSFSRMKTPSITVFERKEVTRDAITLVWDAKDADRYYVTRYNDAACTEVAEVKETTEKEVTFSNLRVNTSYYFTVQAENSFGLGALSACLTEETERGIPADFDGDGIVDVSDFLIFSNVFGLREGDEGFDVNIDLNGNGQIDIPDFILFIDMFGMTE